MSGRGPLAALASERPRLMANEAAIRHMRAVVRKNRTAAELCRKLVVKADELLAKPPLAPPATLALAREFVKRIETLGIVWFATGDPRCRDRAKAELLAVCRFADWRGDEFLVTAEAMFGAAIGYDWLWDGLSEAERQTVAAAVLDKGIRPGLAEFEHDDSAPHWTTSRTNWNLVCNSALMIAAMSVAEADWVAAVRVFELCRPSVAIGFDLYWPDGGWAEGPGYWHYATQYAVYLLDSLGTALGDELGLGDSPGFGNTGMFRLHAAGPSGKLFNFADAEESHSGGYWLLWLARRFHHPIDAWIERQNREVHPMDLLWFDPQIRPASAGRLAPHQRFRAIDVAMLRGDWADPQAIWLGVKGGANDSCRHAHYDLGSFVLDAAGLRWAADLGNDNYSLPGYFEPAQRARYYRTGTIGHNTIVVGGASQPLTAQARILAARFTPALSWLVLDMTTAYPGCACARRGFALIDGRHVVVVDEIEPGPPLDDVVWQMHTAATVEPRGAAAMLTQDRESRPAAHFHLRICEPRDLAFRGASAAPAGPAGQDPNTGFSKLVIDLGRLAVPLRLAVMLSPDAAACAAAALPQPLARPLAAWLDLPRPGHARSLAFPWVLAGLGALGLAVAAGSVLARRK